MMQTDIANAYQEFERVHAVTPNILESQFSPQTITSIDAHKADLNDVIGALEDVESYYGTLKKQATNARKKLERDFEDCKSKYWTVRKSFDRSSEKSSQS